eukprot:TRINITY_DN3634_c0_g1_i1.p1 TRINITY_DN3634_c0_g1~~TRINITY_DN3634_c0_g1_i1.p1  ORF type:complete len:280 (+),score=122.51 TRINITY_DN3634_c0_g1_i1:124-963(+)
MSIKAAFLFTLCLLGVNATAEVLVTSCGALNNAATTYKLANDIVIDNPHSGFVCLDITNKDIILDGNGFEISTTADINTILTTGVRYTGERATVRNLKVRNFSTGIRANGQHGKVQYNTINHANNGIDVSAPHNDIAHNVIRGFSGSDSPSGIYVYFPSTKPVQSFVTITNNYISDITGSTFVLGISVHSANNVKIAYNTLENIGGGMVSQEISITNGKADVESNIINGGAFASTLTFMNETNTKTETKSSYGFLTTAAWVFCLVFSLWFLPINKKVAA